MSGRIRTVKPEWLEDELLALASDAARVLSVALVLLADDYGNGRAGLVLLAGRVFPGRSPETVGKILGELANIRYVVLYEIDGQHYFHIRNWSKHQRVDKPGKPHVPPPPEKVLGTVENIPGTPGNSHASRDPGPGPSPVTDPDPDLPRACPELPDLLTPAQRASLETNSMIPGWAIDAMLADLHPKMLGVPGLKVIGQWRNYAVGALTRRWNNAAERPKKPAPETDPAAAARLIADREAQMEADIVRHRAETAARNAARRAAKAAS